MKRLKIGIAGGGFSGLTLGYKLSQKGHQVTVFEKEKRLGGLASSFKVQDWSWPLDHFYRHVFAKDQDFIQLVKELGQKDKLIYKRALSSVYFQNEIYPFDSPQNILRFPGLGKLSKIRMGGCLALFKYLPYSLFYEKFSTEKTLPKLMGSEGYRLIWQPLLSQKFGKHTDKIPLSWFWARVNSRTTELGYYQKSFSRMANLLAKKIIGYKGKVKKNFEIKNIEKKHDRFILKGNGKTYSFDKIILTCSLADSLRMAGSLLVKEKVKYSDLKSLGAAVLVLRLKDKFFPDQTYWLNILDSSWPFVAAIEHTNFISPKYYHDEHLAYLAGYYPQDHPIFKMDKEEVLKIFLPFAKKINRNIEKKIIESHYYYNLEAQPVPVLNYSQKAPKMNTSVKGLYWLTLHHIYPYDRGVNYAIVYANKLARMV
ncbi:MAG: FAD-dependent oxidoreductase [Candidatus Shapirobacteria bacterium]